MGDRKIFVQIASYRDPELLPTIRDCIEKAKHPELLTFGICWQKDETETLDEFESDPRFRILEYHWSKSKGLCWARSKIQKLWEGEEYTLQLDSHHRFLQDWDEELITMMNLTGSEKPIITTYAGMYRPSDNKLLNTEPYKMVPSNFTPGGTILFRPHHIEDYHKLDRPFPARFVSGHFFFTYGIHCEEYKYDPNIYFAGDEISLSIRSYTLGYDLFHPHKTVVWHEYTREGRTKHWTDFNQQNKESGVVEKQWWEMDNDSKRRLRHMLQEEDNGIDLGQYGLGNVRTHRDYELYAGINFTYRKLHPDAIKGINPPINDEKEWWLDEMKEYKIDVNIDDSVLKQSENIKFIYLGIEDENNKVLFRKDFTFNDDKDIMSGIQKTYVVELKTFEKPHKYVIWPNDGNWLERIDTFI
jgi:hypothetical protein